MLFKLKIDFDSTLLNECDNLYNINYMHIVFQILAHRYLCYGHTNNNRSRYLLMPQLYIII